MNTQVTNRKWIVVSAFLMICLIAYIIWFPPGQKNGETVAKVNGVSLSTNQLYDVMLASSGEQMLDTMITDELIKQESEKTGIQITETDINDQIAIIKSSFPSEEEFQQALSQYGMTLDNLKNSIKSDVLLNKIMKPQITISDDDIKTYYDGNLEALKIPEQVKASRISVATKEEADAIVADLKNGADFAAIAQAKSLDTESKDKGGDLGYVMRGSMEPVFEDAVFALKAGQISDAVQTDSGYDIITVADHKDAYTPSLEEKKEEITKKLSDEKAVELSATWLEQKKSEATVEKFLNINA
ncbi:peptidylprolyl isomerase [Paenibacillus agricola]|uniref:Peptidylprolyl isomerase n=1 Tax=Paenibacillus agricola TaxID=2716264 RepID=A0ABX0JAY3_9BACL|nr:peptidylprolyl isomerase [Paenibacillus agricola]NHN31299.1 peptidylprolyl isomerase [Paenibacillus agricola]